MKHVIAAVLYFMLLGHVQSWDDGKFSFTFLRLNVEDTELSKDVQA